jgi:hypothetical protein
MHRCKVPGRYIDDLLHVPEQCKIPEDDHTASHVNTVDRVAVFVVCDNRAETIVIVHEVGKRR